MLVGPQEYMVGEGLLDMGSNPHIALILRLGLAKLPGLASNLQPFCLSLPVLTQCTALPFTLGGRTGGDLFHGGGRMGWGGGEGGAVWVQGCSCEPS